MRTVEYLISAAIAVVVGVFLLPTSPHEPSASFVLETSQLKNLAAAYGEYASDHEGRLPPGDQTVGQLAAILPYAQVKSTQFRNPTDPVIEANVLLAGMTPSNAGDPSGRVLLFDRSACRSGRRSVAYLDGRARRLSTPEFDLAWSRTPEAAP